MKKNSSEHPPKPVRRENGYTIVAALLVIAIFSILMALSLPVWDRVKQRENEEELIFRGKEYSEAVGRYHAKFNSYPPDLETLYKQKMIRKLYKDPMSDDGKWKILRPDSLIETGNAGEINVPGGKPKSGKGTKSDSSKKKSLLTDTDPDGMENPLRSGNDTSDLEDDDEKEDGGDEVVLGPVAGVVSRSKKTSIRVYNGQTTYNKWVFSYVPLQQVPQQNPNDQKGTKTKKGGEKDNPQKNPNQTPDTKNPDDE